VDLGAVCAVFPYGKILPVEVVQPGGLSFQVQRPAPSSIDMYNNDVGQESVTNL